MSSIRRRLSRFCRLTAVLSSVAALAYAGNAPFDWGSGSNGALGNNSTAGSPLPVAVDTTGVLAGKSIVAVSTGTNHTLALASDGKVYAWGDNFYGQLGNNTNFNSSAPVAVDMTGVLAGKTVTAIAAGDFFNLALASDGRVYTWGYNGYGSLGNNSGIYTQVNAPVAVDMTGVLAGKTVTAIAAGGFCLVLTADNKLFAWGANGYGELGNNTSSISGVPVAVDMTGALAGKTVVAIAAGGEQAMALTSDGLVFTWGLNNLGQLGNGASGGYTTAPGAVDTTGVLAGKTITAIAAGAFHCVALSSTGQLFAWGNNDQGQLGNGTLSLSPQPVAITMTGVLNGVTVSTIAAGYNHSLALSTAGKLYAWGSNTNGAIGGSTAPFSYTTTPVATDTTGVLNGMLINGLGSSESATRTVVYASPAPPAITSQPQSLTVTAGASASFTVGATGAALTYQWSKGATSIPGATSATYSIPGTVLSDAGSYTVTVANAGGAVTSAAATLTVNPAIAPQTITFTPIPNHLYGDAPFGVTATASSGLPVTFSIVTGPASVSGSTVTISGVGSVTVQASQAGDATHASATATQSFTVSPAPATVSLSGLSFVFDGTAKSATVTTVPAALATAVTYNGSPTPPSAVGSYAVTATVTNPNYTGSATGTLVISPAIVSQSVNFAPIPDHVYGDAPFTVLASASSGLPVSFAVASGPASVGGNTVVINGVGTVILTAYQPGNATTLAASASQTFKVTPANASVSVASATYLYDGGAKTAPVSTSPTGLPVTITYNGASAAPSAVGSYAVAATISDPRYKGAATGTLVIVAPPQPPVITTQPQSQLLPFGGTVNLTVAATGDAPLAFQWRRDGVNLPGATGSTLPATTTGAYTAVASNPAGTTTSSVAQVTPASRLANVSARAHVGVGGAVLIPGFVVKSPGTATKQLLIRAVGPGLATFGVTGVLVHPQLTVISGGNVIATNTGWSTASNASSLGAAAVAVGAFPLAPGSADSAVLVDVPAGAYSVVVKGADEGTGVALAEVYEVTADNLQLVNLSARTETSAVNGPTIVGFVVGGTAPARVLIRAVGPTLATYGVTGALAQPRLQVSAGATTLASNTGWSAAANATDIATAATASGAFALPAGSNDCAALLTLPPGAYTAQVSGAGGSAGTVLVEVYQAP